MSMRDKFQAVQVSTDQALKFAPLHVKATAEFVVKPLMMLLAEMLERIEKLEGEKR